MWYILGRWMCSFLLSFATRVAFLSTPTLERGPLGQERKGKKRKVTFGKVGGSVQAAILLPQQPGGGLVVRVGVGEEGRQLYVRRLWKEEGEGEVSRWQFMMPHTWRAHKTLGKI